jgi:protein-S-isoprenylcysteine O-methyltransferase Ste14
MWFESILWARWRVRLGYPLALAFFFLARPAPVSLADGAALVILGLLIRAWAAGFLRKHKGLATGGPYARTRNPLYLGSAILALGFAWAGNSLLGAALILGYFALFYAAVMKREETELQRQYGAAFTEYANKVPLFLPQILPGEPVGGFSSEQYVTNREYQALLGSVLGLLALTLKMHFHW